jgi:hypothetical protein
MAENSSPPRRMMSHTDAGRAVISVRAPLSGASPAVSSEVVTKALIHRTGRITLRAELDEHRQDRLPGPRRRDTRQLMRPRQPDVAPATHNDARHRAAVQPNRRAADTRDVARHSRGELKVRDNRRRSARGPAWATPRA